MWLIPKNKCILINFTQTFKFIRKGSGNFSNILSSRNKIVDNFLFATLNLKNIPGSLISQAAN